MSLSASSHDPRWRLLNWPLLALVLALHGAVLFTLSRHEGINEPARESAEASQFQVTLLSNAPHSPQDVVAAGDAPDSAASTRAAAPDAVTPARTPAPAAAAPARTPAPAAAASKPAPVRTYNQSPGQSPKPTVDQFAVLASPRVSAPSGGSSRATSEPDGGSDGVASGPKRTPDRSPDSNPGGSRDSSLYSGQETDQKTRQDLAGHGQTGVDAQASFDAPSRAAPVTRTQPRVDASWTGNIAPPYPALARRLKLEGEVWLSVHVAADGRVLEAGIARSSGHDMLDATAVESVKKWRFEPATLDGKPVADWYHDWRWHFRIHD